MPHVTCTQVRRLAKDHFVFNMGLNPMVEGNPNRHHHHHRPLHEPGSPQHGGKPCPQYKMIEPGPGVVRDTDNVLTVGEKLHVIPRTRRGSLVWLHVLLSLTRSHSLPATQRDSPTLTPHLWPHAHCVRSAGIVCSCATCVLL